MKLIDRMGQRYGRLEVVGRTTVGKTGVWVCKCDCGKTTLQPGGSLGNGRVISCGCWNEEKRHSHGMSLSKVYIAWQSMLQRCENPKHRAYRLYGGRRVTVSDAWHTFEQFYADMGEPPTKRHSIERIDVNKGYEASNCCWATQREQVNNTRRNILIELNGKSQTATDWANELGISRKTIYSRLDSGWSPIDALTQPLQRGARKRHK